MSAIHFFCFFQKKQNTKFSNYKKFYGLEGIITIYYHRG